MKKETCIISERLGIGQYELDLGDGHHERFSDLHRRPSQTFAFEIAGYFKIESFLRMRGLYGDCGAPLKNDNGAPSKRLIASRSYINVARRSLGNF